jgi:hypothetical protein
MKRLITICLVCMIVSGLSSLSNGVTVDPDAFPAGTVLNNAYPGVTLTALGDVVDSYVLSYTSSLATTGDRVFGMTGGDYLWGDGNYDYMKAAFASGAVQVSLDFIADDYDENATLVAYDAIGNIVDQDASSGTYSPSQFVTLTVSAPYIAYIYAEGDPVYHIDNWALDNLVYTPVPEPATMVLLVLGSLTLLKQRRRTKA